LLLAIGLIPSAAFAATPTETFGRSVRPLLEKNCYECHGDRTHSAKGGLRLDSRDGLLKAVIRP